MRYCNKISRYGKVRRILHQKGLVIGSVFSPRIKKRRKECNVSTLKSPFFSQPVLTLVFLENVCIPHFMLYYILSSNISHLCPQVEISST